MYNFESHFIKIIYKLKMNYSLFLSSPSNKPDTGMNVSIRVVARAHTDTHISQILFLPYDSTRLVSCGRDNFRFWRLKHAGTIASNDNDDNNDSQATLRSCSLNLAPYIQALQNKHSRPGGNSENDQDLTSTISTAVEQNRRVFLEFTDMTMDPSNSNDNLVYACTNNGQIFVINTARMDIENVRVIEPIIEKSGILVNKNKKSSSLALKLNSLAVSERFCVTGSEDGYVRVWPLDFAQVTMEAEHESAVKAVRFSSDCCKIATATLSGNLGKPLNLLC